MKRLTVIVVPALVAAACSSGSDPDVAEVSTTSTTSSETSTTAAASAATTTTTAATTTTDVVVADISSCVVGEWEMDSQQYFEALDGMTNTSGAYVWLIGADGTFSIELRELTFQIPSLDGYAEMMQNGAETGTYTLVGNQLTTLSESSEPLEITIDGVPFDLPVGSAPVAPPNADFSGAIVTCEGDVLTASAEGFQAIGYRTG